jgi:hypothetical protein
VKYKSFAYWLVVFGVTWGQIILISSAIREPTAHNLTLMLAIQASGLYTLILYSMRSYWMPWLAKRPQYFACWLGIFNAAFIETLFWGIQNLLGATDVAAHPNLLIDLALTMPWYAGMVVLFVRFQKRRKFSAAAVLLIGALYEVGADGLVGGQIIPLISHKPVDLVGSWALLAALAFWQFIPVYSSMVLPPAWVLEGAIPGSTRPVTGESGWHAWLDVLSPLLWLVPYTIYVIIIMVGLNLP